MTVIHCIQGEVKKRSHVFSWYKTQLLSFEQRLEDKMTSALSEPLFTGYQSVLDLIWRFYWSHLKHFMVQLSATLLNCCSSMSQSLRSSGRALLAVIKSRLTTKGERASAVRAPQLWSSLPDNLRLTGSMTSLNLFSKHIF